MNTAESEVKAEERIGNYRIHPVAALFPEMDDDTFQGLKDSIRLHGQMVPIVVQGDTLLDGRHRLRACIELKRQPRIEQYENPCVDPGQYIMDLNFERRDLTEAQKLDIADAADPLLAKEEAALRKQREAGKLGGRPKKNPAVNSPQGFVFEIEEPEPKPKPKKPRAPDNRKKLAEKAGVSEHAARQYLNVKKNAPELLDDVKKGKVPLAKAAKVAAGRKPKKPRAPRAWRIETELKKTQKFLARVFERCPDDSREQLKRGLMEVIQCR
jgi:hypothetical protein